MNKTRLSAASIILMISLLGGVRPAIADGSQEAALDRLHGDKLSAAGIDKANVGQLIQQVHSPKSASLSASAAYMLGKLPRNENAISELYVAVRSTDETLVYYASDALLKFGETKWTTDGAAQLYKMKSPGLRYLLAGKLAQAGNYSGWTMIHDDILDPKVPYGGNAVWQIPNFKGMRDSHGQEVDLIQELHLLALNAPLPRRKDIATVMGMLTYKPTPFVPAAVSAK